MMSWNHDAMTICTALAAALASASGCALPDGTPETGDPGDALDPPSASQPAKTPLSAGTSNWCNADCAGARAVCKAKPWAAGPCGVYAECVLHHCSFTSLD